MNHRTVIVKRGQIWERKKDGIRIVIVSGKGDEWFSDRVGNPKINHHVRRFVLVKNWKLITEENG